MDIKNQLIEWAKEYNTPAFIENDPVQFPRKYMNNQMDAEVSGLLTALISFGNRTQIIKKAQELDEMFEGSPSRWILDKKYLYIKGRESFYQVVSNDKFRVWCVAIDMMLESFGTIENSMHCFKNPMDGLKCLLLFNRESCAKRIALFLRWMVRKDGIVDLGLWKTIDSKDLIIPLGTHVHKMALELGITKRNTTDIKTAQEITDYFKTIWPNDPCLGDFSLFGYGVNHK